MIQLCKETGFSPNTNGKLHPTEHMHQNTDTHIIYIYINAPSTLRMRKPYTLLSNENAYTYMKIS